MFKRPSAEISKRWLDVKIRIDWSLEVVRYTFPDIMAPSVVISPKATQWLATLRRDGIVRLEDEEFRKVVLHLEENYFAALEKPSGTADAHLGNPGLFVIDVNKPEYRLYGTEVGANISFRDPKLAGLFFHTDLIGAIYNYYRRQPYYRNQPFLQKISYDGKSPPNANSNWHVDYFHQISIMLLVSDVTDRDTHMQYALGSHRRIRPVANYPEGIVSRKGYRILDAVGRKGTLFLFDAGGIHRARYLGGSSRKILHLNITSGHHIADQQLDPLENWTTLATYPPHCRRMMDKVGRPPL